jgi:hypothetical protein
MCSVLTSLRIIVRLSGRLRANTSETRLRPPSNGSRSFEPDIYDAVRHAVTLIWCDSPILQAHILTWLAEAYPSTHARALEDTRFYTLPEKSPFIPAQVLNIVFWPAGPPLAPWDYICVSQRQRRA